MSAATQHRREVTSSCASGRVALTMHQHTREWMWSCCAKPQSSIIRLFWGKLSGKLSGKRVQQSGGTAMKRRFASSPNVPRSSRFPSLNLGRTALRRCTDWLAEYAVSLPEFGRFCGIQVGDVKLGEAQVLAYRPTDSFPFVQVPRRTLESDSCVLRVEELIAHRLRSQVTMSPRSRDLAPLRPACRSVSGTEQQQLFPPDPPGARDQVRCAHIYTPRARTNVPRNSDSCRW